MFVFPFHVPNDAGPSIAGSGQLTDYRERLAETGGRTLHQLQGYLTSLLRGGSGSLPLVLI